MKKLKIVLEGFVFRHRRQVAFHLEKVCNEKCYF